MIDDDLETLVSSMLQNGVVFFLGAGANLCDRGANEPWVRGKNLPNGEELAQAIAAAAKITPEESSPLSLVAQWAVAKKNVKWLSERLRNIFIESSVEPTSLHHFLARLPGTLRGRGYPRTQDPVQSRMIVLSTNYDGLLEEAFRRANERCHVFTYRRNGNNGRFWHRDPNTGSESCIDEPVNFAFHPDDHHTAIVKLHGVIHRDSEIETFVITEDDYSQYLVENANMRLIPRALGKQLAYSRFLFLGYSLSDWTMRAHLQLIWKQRKDLIDSFAIQLRVGPLDAELWKHRGVKIIEMPIESFLQHFRHKLDAGLR